MWELVSVLTSFYHNLNDSSISRHLHGEFLELQEVTSLETQAREPFCLQQCWVSSPGTLQRVLQPGWVSIVTVLEGLLGADVSSLGESLVSTVSCLPSGLGAPPL